MKALGIVEVYSFTTAVCAADAAAKAADVKIIAFDRNRPIKEDVPAPLVMAVKMEGEVADVRSAVDAAAQYAKSKGRYIVSHVIARPDDDTENMAFLMDINKDKFNKKLPKSFRNASEADGVGLSKASSIGLLEVQGLVASIEGLDTMLKAANVRLIHTEKRLGGRLVTIVVTGSVSDVAASVESGKNLASRLGKVYGCEVIARPHDEVIKFFDTEA